MRVSSQAGAPPGGAVCLRLSRAPLPRSVEFIFSLRQLPQAPPFLHTRFFFCAWFALSKRHLFISILSFYFLMSIIFCVSYPPGPSPPHLDENGLPAPRNCSGFRHFKSSDSECRTPLQLGRRLFLLVLHQITWGGGVIWCYHLRELGFRFRWVLGGWVDPMGGGVLRWVHLNQKLLQFSKGGMCYYACKR